MVYQFWLPFVLLWLIIIILDRRSGLLRDISTANPAPYSWSRVQLAWWTVIILSSLIAIVWHDMQTAPPANIPTLHYSTLVLLGISAATTTVSNLIDTSDISNMPGARHQDQPTVNLLMDILSDQDGISIHRLQAVVFNLVFGIWFISIVLYNLAAGHDPCSLYAAGSQLATACKANTLDYMMPVITDNNLILLGLSSATYAAIKTTENKNQVTPAAGTANPAVMPGTANTTTMSTTVPAAPVTTVTTPTNITNTP